jgi:t-SNARE complex subunit (syntaxin)
VNDCSDSSFLLVKPDATPTEIESTIDSDETPQIFAHSVMEKKRKDKDEYITDMQ